MDTHCVTYHEALEAPAMVVLAARDDEVVVACPTKTDARNLAGELRRVGTRKGVSLRITGSHTRSLRIRSVPGGVR